MISKVQSLFKVTSLAGFVFANAISYGCSSQGDIQNMQGENTMEVLEVEEKTNGEGGASSSSSARKCSPFSFIGGLFLAGTTAAAITCGVLYGEEVKENANLEKEYDNNMTGLQNQCEAVIREFEDINTELMRQITIFSNRAMCSALFPGCMECSLDNNGDPSSCIECSSGFYIERGISCVSCEIPDCQTNTSESCTGTETAPPTCTTCFEGYYPSADNSSCIACDEVTNCAIGGLTCTSDKDETCISCKPGFYLSALNTTCTSCIIPNCGTTDPLLCNGNETEPATCTTCSNGYYPASDGRSCTACPDIDKCLTTLCISATKYACFECIPGSTLSPDGTTCAA